jgi:hypothetical protein
VLDVADRLDRSVQGPPDAASVASIFLHVASDRDNSPPHGNYVDAAGGACDLDVVTREAPYLRV